MGDKPRILVVDDILANRRLASKILANDYVVETVRSGEEAIDYLTRTIPDLVLLDIRMEGMDGFETLARMRRHKATNDLPVIFLTADDENETEAKGFREGAMDFIVKPFVPVVMKARVARAIELAHLRAELREEVQRQTERHERLSLQTIRTLVETIEWRSHIRKGHSRRVADYAWQIAEQMGELEGERDRVYYMGLLHDVGRISIPDEILHKEDEHELTDADKEIVHQSTIIGSDILKNITELPDIWKGAHCYKEHYDGTGYPDKLKGDDIPQEGRIIAAACVYDKLTSKRWGLTQQEVRAELEKMSGTRLDPQIVKTMLEMMDEDTDYNWRE